MSFKSNQFDSQLKKSTINKDRVYIILSRIIQILVLIKRKRKIIRVMIYFYKIDEVLSNQVKYDSLTKQSSAVLDMEFKVNELEARLRELSRRESLNTNKQDTTILELVIR